MLSTWTKIEPVKNCYRFYSISLASDLFDDFVVTCEWGRIGARKPHRKVITFSSINNAIVFVEQAEMTRIKHHYKIA